MHKKAKFIFTIISVVLLLIMLQVPSIVFATDANEISLDEFNFPDENFRIILKEKFSEITKDNILTNEEIQKIQALDVSENIIKDLSGIEYFTNLKYLNVSVNKINALDLSNNINLVTIDASNNQSLTSIKLPKNIVNVYLNFNYNLKTLDISEHRNIKILYAADVAINNINVSDLNNLVALDLENTGLNTIDLANNIDLEYLNLSNNNLKEINLSNNINLITLNLINNKLNKIYLPNSVRKNTSVEYYSQKVDNGFIINWYEGDALISEENEIEMKGQILTAKLKAKPITISYQSNGGTGKMGSQTISFGETIHLLQNNFTRKGYIFKGWSTSSNTSKVQYQNQDILNILQYPSKGKVILYAVWEPIKYTIEFDVNNGTGSMEPMENLYYGTRYQLIDNNFTREGYKFLGWSKVKGSNVVHLKNKESIYNLVSEEGGKIRLYAIWQKIEYSVSFNVDGKITSSKVEHNDKVREPQNPVKTGYTFIGWYDSKTNEKYNFTNHINSSITLIAKWRANEYNVAFDGNTNTKKNMNSVKLTYDKTYKLPANTYAKEGYKFIGWAIFQNGEVKYTNESSIKNLSSIDNETVTLYAKWEKIKSNDSVQVSNVNKKQIKNLNISNISNKTYTGKQIKPSVTVKDGKTTLKNGIDYIVSYGKNKNTGKAYIKITGKGKYTGTITKYFNIVPKAPSVRVKAGKASITVASASTGASGYEILYATSKKGKFKSINTASKTKKITRLTKGKIYYVKVRAYKIINGKKVYSGYSSIKMIKIK